MPPGKDVPGPMVEDGPPAGVPEEDVAPAPEEQQENQRTVDLGARNRILNCLPFRSACRCWSKTWRRFYLHGLKRCHFAFQPEGGTTVQDSRMMTGATSSSEGRRGPTTPRFGQRSPKGDDVSKAIIHTSQHCLLRPTAGVLPEGLSWGPLGFHHQSAPAQRGDAPAPAS